MTLVVVTATTNYDRAQPCIDSWGDVQKILVVNGSETGSRAAVSSGSTVVASRTYLGTVPAFQVGVDFALDHTNADIICALHDDVEILDPSWAEKVVRHFERHPACGLAGFGGAIGLGDADIYQTPYSPMQLARIGFRSNLVDAEVHGIRSLLAEKVACLDGFSQIGRRQFWAGDIHHPRPLTDLTDHGIVHHAYDSLLGCYAARADWEVWYLPVRVRHLGGQTAVGDAGYQSWAQQQIPGGDQGFWQQSHRRGYDLFKDVLPLRI
jgi:hypothetical protein